MDQRITLQRRTESPDGGGGVVRGWANVERDAVVWAEVFAKAAREGLDEGRVNATMTILFTIWNRDDLSETCRILWNGEVYNIRGLRRMGGRQLRLVIEAERGVAE